jgi:cytochrome c-type biogenesis protein CcsB
MKNISKILFSQKVTLVLITIFAVAIGVATFIEQNHDTATAKMMVYNSRWMELLLFLLTVNLTGSIFQRKLYRKEKITILLFHLGFIVMILGAAVTRYIGYEGSMHIREGESSNVIFSSETYLMVNTSDDTPIESFKIDRKDLTTKPFRFTFDVEEKGEMSISYKDYVFNATEEIFENQQGGKDMLEIRVATDHGPVSGMVEDGKTKIIGNLSFGFNTEGKEGVIQIQDWNNALMMRSTFDLFRSTEDGKAIDSVSVDSVYEFVPNQIYNGDSTLFMLVHYYRKAKTKLVSGKEGTENPDALIAELSYQGKTKEIELFGGDGYIGETEEHQMDDLSLKIGYGNKPIEVPFSIYLENFILERYPGSNSPSSFESKVILTDERSNLKENHRIYMNNILDYDGYRFFQSSYDRDERGTILSVSHDWWGTIITYLSYILLLVGFVSTFFNRHSRFNMVRKRIANTGKAGKATIVLLLLIAGLSGQSFSQTEMHQPVDKEHADRFGHLIVQTFDGRFQPVHTLASDVIHKLYKKNTIDVPGKGKLDAMQFYLDLIIDSEYWKTQKIIYVKDPTLQNAMGLREDYASFYDFFDGKGQYKLANYTELAYMKSKSEQNNFDRDVMKVNERLNILFMTLNASMLKIFPDEQSKNHKWVSLEDTASYRPLSGSIAVINEDLQLKVLSYSSILQLYFQHLIEGTMTGNYTRADQILGYMKNIQRQAVTSDILPSEAKINLEVSYNKARFFVLLKYFYMILSVFMLILAFQIDFGANKKKLIRYLFNFLIVLLGAAFLYHTYGLVLRWYLTGHAPWSNGYEVLVFVPWVSILAGFIFMKYSKIVLAATVLLAFFMLLTAGFSNYDPQLTNLQPVLKSYWLIIHVAVIVISYGFFGIGFVLGLINLFLFIFKTVKNESNVNTVIKDLSNINEITLLFGIVMATIGTFLGAVWANESWGRYWGWDAKETWALIILMVYAAVLHFRLIPTMNKSIIFNSATVVAFGTVIMTFFGVNYYLSKGLHSYASGGGGIFPMWAWIAIVAVFVLILTAANREKKFKSEE